MGVSLRTKCCHKRIFRRSATCRCTNNSEQKLYAKIIETLYLLLVRTCGRESLHGHPRLKKGLVQHDNDLNYPIMFQTQPFRNRKETPFLQMILNLSWLSVSDKGLLRVQQSSISIVVVAVTFSIRHSFLQSTLFEGKNF
ncbi:hypothetical protein V2G26_006802 [Clonostachys chloroleuca]